MELWKRDLIRDSRLETYTLADPERKSVVAALAADGRHTVEQAESIVDWCGTRMQLLSKPLGPTQDAPSYEEFLARMRSDARAAFKATFNVAKMRGQSRELAELLELVETAEAGHAPFPDLDRLPPVFGGITPSSILFLDEELGLRFQTHLLL